MVQILAISISEVLKRKSKTLKYLDFFTYRCSQQLTRRPICFFNLLKRRKIAWRDRSRLRDDVGGAHARFPVALSVVEHTLLKTSFSPGFRSTDDAQQFTA
jgi:hypothetical protein